jgi:hypothetical protein
MSDHHTPPTSNGVPLTDELLDTLAEEAEAGYDRLRPRRVWRRRRGWRWPLGVALGFLVLQVLLAPSSVMFPDSAQYARISLQYQGDDYATALAEASSLYCADLAKQLTVSNTALMVPDPSVNDGRIEQQCVAGNAASGQFAGQPRYRAIFDSRPGYPLAVAALTPVLGIRSALWIVPVLATLLAGLAVWWTLAVLGVAPGVAAVGQAALYLLPIGTWGVQPLTEGPVLLGVTVAMAGAVGLALGRWRPGLALLLTGLAVTVAVKYSTALPLACALGAAGAAGQLVGGRRRALAVLSGIGILATMAIAAVSSWLGMPSVMESVQDAFTNHFVNPDVPDGWHRLLSANVRYWEHWPVQLSSNVLLAAATVLAAWALWHRHRPTALIVLAAAALGIALTVVHPDATQGDRLYSLLWLAPVIGLPVAVSRATARAWTGGTKAPRRDADGTRQA